MQNTEKRALLVSPRGFCFGVERGIKILDDTLAHGQGTVYVRKEIVHNTVLVDHYKSLGVAFVDELDEIPEGSVAVFSTHGVAPSVRDEATRKNLTVVDATCPLVTKVHNEAVRFKEQGASIILVGDAAHPEVIGIMAEAPGNIHLVRYESDIGLLEGVDEKNVAWISQTTLNFDETEKIVERLREKYPLLQDPPQSDICYATRNRQLAVRNVASECDLFIAVGSEKSNNTNKLAEVALEAGARKAIRVDKPEELSGVDLSSIVTIGITSGVSVTEKQLEGVVAYLEGLGYLRKEEAATRWRL